MKMHRFALRRVAPLVVALLASTACASSAPSAEDTATGMEGAPEQAETSMFRVENDTPEQTLEIMLRSEDGDRIPLGVVSSGDTETFILPPQAQPGEYELIAAVPNASTVEEIVSDAFTTTGGATVNWYIRNNRIEVT
ncbi:MAG TPA: hypothetical protein VK858_07620 [Longimicrobiales bacterium]|nr:hypothetical protein [Longimicrobiales bacterium]